MRHPSSYSTVDSNSEMVSVLASGSMPPDESALHLDSRSDSAMTPSRTPAMSPVLEKANVLLWLIPPTVPMQDVESLGPSQ